jgi:hypothetical protein
VWPLRRLKEAGGATPAPRPNNGPATWGATPCIKDRPCPRVRSTLNWGLCRNGSDTLKVAKTIAPINVATPVAIRAKKNLVIYLGGLSSLLFSHATCDLIGSSSASSTRSHFGHSNVRRTVPVGPGSIRASIMRAWHQRQSGRSTGISDRSTEPNTVMLPGPGGDDSSLFQAAASLCSLVYTSA